MYIFIALLLLVVHGSSAATFGDSIRKCNPENRQALGRCLRLVLEDLKPRLATGIPEINIPVLEPLYIDQILLEDNQGGINMKSLFTDVYLHGISGFTTKRLRVGENMRFIDLTIYVPRLFLNGTYKIEGGTTGFFPLALKGNGPFEVELRKVELDFRGDLDIVGREPEERLKLLRSRVDFEADDSKLHLGNLFNGNKLLGRVVNQVLNDNSEEILEEMKPTVLREIRKVMNNVLSDALSALRLRDLIKLPPGQYRVDWGDEVFGDDGFTSEQENRRFREQERFIPERRERVYQEEEFIPQRNQRVFQGPPREQRFYQPEVFVPAASRRQFFNPYHYRHFPDQRRF